MTGTAGPGAAGILSRGEVSEWLKVPLSKSGVRKHRGFESHPLRQPRTSRMDHPFVAGSAPSLTHINVRSVGCSPAPWADHILSAREYLQLPLRLLRLQLLPLLTRTMHGRGEVA